MTFTSLGSFAAHLLTIEADLHITEEVCVEKACRMVEKEAKAAIGTYRFDWTPLQPETIAHKARGDTPLLETGELQKSIEHVVGREGAMLLVMSGQMIRSRNTMNSGQEPFHRGHFLARRRCARNTKFMKWNCA
jgi:hypothetical protein